MEPGYYRLIKPYKEDDDADDAWVVGQLVYFVGWHGDQVHVVYGDSGWYLSEEEFVDHFEFAPEGLQERQQRMADLMSGLHNLGGRTDHLLTEQQSLPALTFQDPDEIEAEFEVVSTEETEEAPEQEQFNALSTTMSDQIAHAAGGIKKVKTRLATVRKQIARRNKELQLLIREQELILREKVNALTEQMEMAGEAIYILNAYLGKDEELVRIKNGKRADADEKLVIRQLILYMDEEAAAAEQWAERGGIDFQKIEEFDKWVVKPQNLDQVCPEKKGIVAIKPRRNDKFYSDNPFENAELNRANKCLYLLVRNGDLVYRIYTSLWLQDVLFPRKDEFEGYFYERDYDWDTHERVRKPMRPGSAKYMEAMKASDKHRRRFYAALLLIQGILDRTKVLQPLPVEGRLNIVDIHESVKYCTFLQDAENLLGDGRPKFRDWLDQVNSTIGVGSRIIGNFGGYSNDEYTASWTREERRKHPRSARSPRDDSIYVLETKDGGYFKFYYSREGETVYHGWDDWGGRPARNRASFKIESSDRFILNFDAATIGDLEYYINSRLHRHQYETMLPLMNVAVKMKRREAKEEEPFRYLLVGSIMGAHGVSQTVAEDRIDLLISWYKFKNKYHRALTTDDSKALRMIVKEFGRRWKLEKQQVEMKEDLDEAVEVLLDDEPNTLAIFHRRDNQYVVLKWHNEQNIFVREEHWEDIDNDLKCVKVVEWKTLDARHKSWTILWNHPRWDEWDAQASENEHMSDPEREQAMAYGIKALGNKTQLRKKVFGWYDKPSRKEEWLAPLAAVFLDSGKACVYFLEVHAKFPKEGSLTEKAKSPVMGRLIVGFKKSSKGIEFSVENVNTVSCGYEGKKAPWNFEYSESLDSGRSLAVCKKLWQENIDAAIAEVREVKAFNDAIREKLKPVDRIERQCHKVIEAKWWEDEYRRFHEEYDDPDDELWEDHKEEIREPGYHNIHPHWVEGVLVALLENGIEIDGITIEEAVKTAKKFKVKLEDRHQESYEALKDVVCDASFGVKEEEEDDCDYDDD